MASRYEQCLWRVMLAAFILILMAPTPSKAQQEINVQDYRYLFNLSSEMRSASLGDDISLEQYKSVMKQACTVLVKISKDPTFDSILRRHGKDIDDPKVRADVAAVYQDFQTFLKFLAVERTLLQKADIAEGDIDQILGNLMSARQIVVDKLSGKVDALENDLQHLSEQTCKIADTITDDLDRAARYSAIRRYTLFTSGAILTIVDGAAGLATFGISVPVSAASIAGGAVLMGLPGIM